MKYTQMYFYFMPELLSSIRYARRVCSGRFHCMHPPVAAWNVPELIHPKRRNNQFVIGHKTHPVFASTVSKETKPDVCSYHAHIHTYIHIHQLL